MWLAAILSSKQLVQSWAWLVGELPSPDPCVYVCSAVYLSSCERWLGAHNRHAWAGQHKIVFVNYRLKLPRSLTRCCLRESNCFARCSLWGSAPVMYTKNSIKRCYSSPADRAFDGLLPSSTRSNIASLKLLHRYCAFALSKFTSDCVFFPLIHVSALLLCIWFTSERRKES